MSEGLGNPIIFSSGSEKTHLIPNLSDENTSDALHHYWEGIKTPKWRRNYEDKFTFLKTIKEENKKFREMSESSAGEIHCFDIVERKNEFRQQMRDDNILMIDPKSWWSGSSILLLLENILYVLIYVIGPLQL